MIMLANGQEQRKRLDQDIVDGLVYVFGRAFNDAKKEALLHLVDKHQISLTEFIAIMGNKTSDLLNSQAKQ